MKNVLAASALTVALLAGTAMSAQAATVTYDRGSIGTFSESNTGGDFLKINSAKQMFDLAYTFTLSVAGYVSANANNAYTIGTKSNTKISNFLLTVDGVQGLTTDQFNGQISNYPPTSSLILFQPGTYNLDITGTTGTPNSSVGLSFSFTASPSTVPLPASSALFGVALVGLGVFGATRRKARSATAAA